MRFHSFEQPPPERVAELQEQIKIKSELKPQLAIIWPLSELREAAFEELKKEKPSADVIQKLRASDDMIERKIGDNLAGIIRDYPTEKKQPGSQGESPDYASWLFSTRKPAFATKHPERLANTMETIGDIVAELKKKFGDGFIGVTLFGSTAKGYWEPESDLDFMVIADNEDVYEEFIKRLQFGGIYPCLSCVYDFELPRTLKRQIDTQSKGGHASALISLMRSIIHKEQHKERHKAQHKEQHDEMLHKRRISLEQSPQTVLGSIRKREALANLFHGLFLGDHKAFSKLQEYVASSVSSMEWDMIRMSISDTETNLFKARGRLGISSNLEQAKNKAAALILRTPPAHEEALRILQSRAR